MFMRLSLPSFKIRKKLPASLFLFKSFNLIAFPNSLKLSDKAKSKAIRKSYKAIPKAIFFALEREVTLYSFKMINFKI